MVESLAAFLQTGGLQSRPRRSVHSAAWVSPQRHDQLSFHGRFPRRAMTPARLLGSSRADALVIVTHQRLQRRCAPVLNREPKLDSLRATSVHFRGNLADKMLDPSHFLSDA